MQTAPLYPQAWNRWQLTLTGPPRSDPGAKALRVDDESRVTRWLIHWLGDLDEVRFYEKLDGKSMRRREDLDIIPILPPGETHELSVGFWYDGDQQSIAWPADDEIMLTRIVEPDRESKAPETWYEKVGEAAGEGAKSAGDELKSLVLTLGIAAVLIAVAASVTSRSMRGAS